MRNQRTTLSPTAITNLMWCLATVVWCAGLYKLLPYSPLCSFVPTLFLISACIAARGYRSPNTAWELITIGWLILILKLADSHVGAFQFIGTPNSFALQWDIKYGSICLLSLPSFITIPAVYFAIQASVNTRSNTRKWIWASAVIAAVDGLMLTLSIYWIYELAPF